MDKPVTAPPYDHINEWQKTMSPPSSLLRILTPLSGHATTTGMKRVILPIIYSPLFSNFWRASVLFVGPVIPLFWIFALGLSCILLPHMWDQADTLTTELCRCKVFINPPLWYAPGLYHNNFPVVKDPGQTKHPPLLWQTPPFFDELWVLRYWIGFHIWWQMNFYRWLCY